MGYIIYTNSENLRKSMRYGLIRLPQRVHDYFDLRRIEGGDNVFLYDYERKKIFGPFIAESNGVTREKNPQEGPFNGAGNVISHYFYESIHVVTTKLFTTGVSIYSGNYIE